MIKPWYEQSFGNDYMMVYKHRNWDEAAKEMANMMNWLGLPQGASVLDIGCGMGRHALALHALGYRVTGVDLSPILLEEAQKHDAAHDVEWRHGDMRSLPFDDGSFDATVNLFTSFGYFSAELDNVRVLQEIRRVLKQGGSFLIDFLHPAYVTASLDPQSERVDEETGQVITEQRAIKEGWVTKEITIKDPSGKQGTRQYLEQVRLYSLDWFERELKNAGLQLERVYGGYDGSALTEQSPRMIMHGRVRE